jgi:superfamily I DNA and/or RNA helicase
MMNNYQGEESDIIVASLTRNNNEGDIRAHNGRGASERRHH